MPHHRDPAQTFQEQFAQRLVIGNGGDRIREQHHLASLLRNQPSDQQIVRRLVLDRRIAAELPQVGSRGRDRRPQRELHPFQLPGHQDTRVKIRKHPNVLQPLHPRGFIGRHIKAGGRPNLRACQRRNQAAEIGRIHAHIAVANDQMFIRRLLHQSRQLGNFIVGCFAS